MADTATNLAPVDQPNAAARAHYSAPQFDKIEANTIEGFMEVLNKKGKFKWEIEGQIYMDCHWWTREPYRYWCFIRKEVKAF